MKSLNSFIVLAAIGGVFGSTFQPSSTATVSFIGGVIKARHQVSEDAKYPRDECPVCEGKGWYISGDKIEKVDCGYCEPVKKEEPTLAEDPLVEEDLPLVPVEPKQYFLR